MTDLEIYNGIAVKDNRTFQFLYREHQQGIANMIRKNNGNEQDGLDIFQEGLIALWVNINQGKFQLKDNVKLSTYLFSICRNLWISKLRKTKPMVVLDEVRVEEIDREVEDIEENYSQVKTLEKHLKLLSESCQKLLRLFYYKKASLKDIAIEMNYGEKTAKNNKYRCMQKLRAFYESENQSK